MEKFLNKLAEDETLRSEFLNQTTPEGAYKVAKPYIGSMSMEEFAEQMVGLARLMTKAESGQLSEDDLDTVAGGASFTGFLTKLQGFGEKVATAGDKLHQGVETVTGVAGKVGQAAGQVGEVWTGIKGTATGLFGKKQ